MIAVPMGISRARKFWLWYAAAWLPMLAVYVYGFLQQGRREAADVALAALANVLPEALLGIAVVHACRRAWRLEDGARGRVLLVGLAFLGAAMWLKTTLNLLLMRSEVPGASWADYDLGILLWQSLFSALVFAILASVTYGLGAAARLREEEERRSQADLMRVRSELKALRSQLNPHFLFNALHSLGALMRENPDSAELALDQLGDLLRYSLRVQDAAEDGVLLLEEWEFVRAYLALEKLRLGERLCVEQEASEAALQSVVPAFVLQPLAENAIRHGIGASERGGTVRIRARLEGPTLELEVRDDGPGNGGHATKGSGKGLELVRQRLRALYGAAGTVEVASAPGTGYAVTLRFPGTRDEP